jgi:hypothetical protein
MKPGRASLLRLTEVASNLRFPTSWAQHPCGPESIPIRTVAIPIILTLSIDSLATGTPEAFEKLRWLVARAARPSRPRNLRTDRRLRERC